MNEQPKTKWRWRLLRWGLIGLAVLITLAAIVITEENWRARRDWENFKRAAAARGEILERQDSTTNPIPDDQNFTKAPVFTSLWAMKWDEKEQSWKSDGANTDKFAMYPARNDGSWADSAKGNWMHGTLTDMKAWQTYYRTPITNGAGEFPIAPQPQSAAADVLLALSKFDPAIEAWRQASQRPSVRFADDDVNDDRTMSLLLVYLADFKRCFQVLQLRTEAELAVGQNDQALADAELMLHLNDRLRQEPLLIAHLVSLATMNITMQPIFEGLARHAWSDAKLAELEKEIAKKDFLSDYQKAMRGERTFAIGYLENLRLTREYKVPDLSSSPVKVKTVDLRLVPAAFFYRNELAAAQLDDQFCLKLVDLDQRVVLPATVRQAEAMVQGEIKHYHPYKIMALMGLPAIAKSVEKFAAIQTDADLAQVACALERYRLAHGEYPETTDALAPQYVEKLPHDVINGQSLHYHRTGKGHFILYSVGWNETDDGGQIAFRKGGTVDRDKGDWVWNSGVE